MMERVDARSTVPIGTSDPAGKERMNKANVTTDDHDGFGDEDNHDQQQQQQEDRALNLQDINKQMDDATKKLNDATKKVTKMKTSWKRFQKSVEGLNKTFGLS